MQLELIIKIQTKSNHIYFGMFSILTRKFCVFKFEIKFYPLIRKRECGRTIKCLRNSTLVQWMKNVLSQGLNFSNG